MDTRLKNYEEMENELTEAKQKGGLTKSLVWAIGGMVFVAAATMLFQRVCKIFWLYDFENFLRWGPDEIQGLKIAEDTWEHLAALLSDDWKWALIYLGIALITFILCVWTTGKKLSWFDKIFTEIQIIGVALTVFGFAGVAVIHMDSLERSDWYHALLVRIDISEREKTLIHDYRGGYTSFEPQWLETFFAYVATGILVAICLLIILSWVKKLKARCFWRTTLVGALIGGTCDTIRDSKGIQGKIILLLLIGALLSATWIGLIAVIVFIIFYVPKQVKKYTAICDGVEEVKNGNLSYKIPVDAGKRQGGKLGEKPGELDRLAMSINEISDAMSVAVANELKNQKMKTDLISNVSHDLKTPLTSMVSYVDLLKSEGLDGENAPEYLHIIDEKTRRLRKLTEDLFEAAKASSGSIPVHIDRIEMTSIIGQALAEVEERLDASDLDVIFTDKTGSSLGEGTYVMADGQLLWRVMENLLVNVSKYALPGSRVYLDLVDRGDGHVLMELKNMSKERLNIEADELMERFKRGDESRNTEGSGLGLAIAKDLVKLMDGEFSLTIDGDLFKASVAMKKA